MQFALYVKHALKLIFIMKKHWFIAALMALACASASATGFYVVVPVQGKQVPGSINVALGSYTLPSGLIGTPYDGFNLKTLLSVTGDPDYTGYGVRWSLASGSLPAGLTLDANGAISGTPTATGTASFSVRATYKTKAGVQAYQIYVGTITIGLAAATPPTGVVGQSYSYDLKPLLSVTGDKAYTGTGVTWSVVSNTLPAGLYLTTDGVIAGTPTASGTGSVTARATYKTVKGEQTYDVVTLAIGVSLAAATPPDAVVGLAYNYDLKPLLAVTGDAAYTGSGVTWSVVSSTLPAGLYLTADGRIAGTPTAAGTGSVTARASYRGVNGQQAYQTVSLAIQVTLAAATAPDAVVGVAYNYDLKPLLAVTGDAAYSGSGVTWSVVSSTLPAGLYLTADGRIAGTPTAAGTGSVTARASYKGVNGQQAYQVVSLAVQVTLAAATAPDAVVGVAYNYDLKPLLSVTGDSAYTGSGVTWSVVSGTLPAGLALTTDGRIAGTPTAAGTGSVTARASYKGVNGQQAYQVVSLAIQVTLAAATAPNAFVGVAYSYDLKPLLSVTGDSAYTGSGVTWNAVSSTLPAGLSLTTDGRIAGTPTAAGTGSVTARASYKGVNGQQAYQVVSQVVTHGLVSFTTVGTQTWTVPPGITSVAALVVGGGGGGGSWINDNPGGGGGGGVLYSASYSVTPGQQITVNVGAGGYGGDKAYPSGTPIPAGVGGSSSFGSLTAQGGGGGAEYVAGKPCANATSGGSGGGGSSSCTTAGAGTSGQGTAGAPGGGGSGGGGGGAGGAATNSNGGPGIANAITGSTVYYGGGGGGIPSSGTSSGGIGGGGAGGSSSAQGAANTGGGGGAYMGVYSNGGSGIVIVKY
ncbi:hypothetical protein WL29_22340 [Burkholderia ubonensis]|uniref:Glycine-rich domain-containing protein n=1 Tax=Burkholderia ubonensis TaxID=101571 RepID=A0A119HFL5_9BURK|nr:Ig domain-containing protein [Burkholderia ubonensis]KWA84107.1 hypothetical protein WL29_22340 [Burkholderia ubonensis]